MFSTIHRWQDAGSWPLLPEESKYANYAWEEGQFPGQTPGRSSRYRGCSRDSSLLSATNGRPGPQLPTAPARAAQGGVDDEDQRWSFKDNKEREKSGGMRERVGGDEVAWAEWSIEKTFQSCKLPPQNSWMSKTIQIFKFLCTLALYNFTL